MAERKESWYWLDQGPRRGDHGSLLPPSGMTCQRHPKLLLKHQVGTWGSKIKNGTQLRLGTKAGPLQLAAASTPSMVT